MKWKHYPRYWPFVRGIHRSPVNSLHKGQWCGALMFALICAWINCSSKKRRGWWFETLSRPLWRHCSVLLLLSCSSYVLIPLCFGITLYQCRILFGIALYLLHKTSFIVINYFQSEQQTHFKYFVKQIPNHLNIEDTQSGTHVLLFLEAKNITLCSTGVPIHILAILHIPWEHSTTFYYPQQMVNSSINSLSPETYIIFLYNCKYNNG